MGNNKINLFIILLIFLFILSLAGVWDREEISEQALVTIIGVDKKDEEYILALEYQLLHEQSSTENSSIKLKSKFVIADGKTFADASNSYYREVTDDTYLGMIRAVVLSDEFASDGIEEYLNRINGKKEYRKIPNIFTTSTEFEKLFDTEILKIQNTGFEIEHLIAHLSQKGIDYNVTVPNVHENLNVKNTGFLTNHIDVVDDQIKNVGYSIFKEKKKIGFIPSEEIKGINYLIVKNAQSSFTVDFNKTIATVEVYLKNKKIKPLYKNGDITFNIDFFFKSHLINTSKSINIDDKQMKELGKKVEARIKQQILDTLKTSQKEFECDYLYLYKYFRAKYNSDFQKMNWNEKYKDAKFNIDVKVDLMPSNLINFNFK